MDFIYYAREWNSIGGVVLYRISKDYAEFWHDEKRCWCHLVFGKDVVVNSSKTINPKTYDHEAFAKEQFYEDLLGDAD